MEITIGEEKYYIPKNLTEEQKVIYCHIIDWKRKHITAQRGKFKNNEYDAIFPGEYSVSPMMYKPLVAKWEKMQEDEKYAYKIHEFAYHAVSSQTACVNLFMPILLSEDANDILPRITGCPSDFKRIAREELFQGFCFEYWGQDICRGKGLLNDHSNFAGTDADVAIAYYDTDDRLCLWLIEHKLSEKDFTPCGAYKSDANKHKANCITCDLAALAENPQLCHYHSIGFRYWELLKSRIEVYSGRAHGKGCPFRGGLNQLWRNQMLAFALQKKYASVTFSVCHHQKNTMLQRSINQYKALIKNDKMFNSFTNYEVMDAVGGFASADVAAWKKWYEEVYCF